MSENDLYRKNAVATRDAARMKKIPLIVEQQDIDHAHGGDYSGVQIPCLSPDDLCKGYILQHMFSAMAAGYPAILRWLVQENRLVAGKAYALFIGTVVNVVAEFEPNVYGEEKSREL